MLLRHRPAEDARSAQGAGIAQRPWAIQTTAMAQDGRSLRCSTTYSVKLANQPAVMEELRPAMFRWAAVL